MRTYGPPREQVAGQDRHALDNAFTRVIDALNCPALMRAGGWLAVND